MGNESHRDRPRGSSLLLNLLDENPILGALYLRLKSENDLSDDDLDIMIKANFIETVLKKLEEGLSFRTISIEVQIGMNNLNGNLIRRMEGLISAVSEWNTEDPQTRRVTGSDTEPILIGANSPSPISLRTDNNMAVVLEERIKEEYPNFYSRLLILAETRGFKIRRLIDLFRTEFPIRSDPETANLWGFVESARRSLARLLESGDEREYEALRRIHSTGENKPVK